MTTITPFQGDTFRRAPLRFVRGRTAKPRRPAPPRPSAIRPRIAIVAASLEILGGQGVQARALVERLRGEGRDVTFIPVNPRFPARLQRIRRYPYARTVLNQALYFQSLAQLRRADVVHIFSASYWSFLLASLPAIVAARVLGKRVILNYHSGEAGDHLARWGILVHPWLRLADEIVVPSDYLKNIFSDHGYRTRVIRNVVDTSHYQYRERTLLRPRILSTRNLEAYYGIDNTINAFSLLKLKHPDAVLTIAGYGREEKSLKRLAASVDPERIRFVGRVEPRFMPRLYAEADIFVNSSFVDNQPLSVLEAFAAGLPVVSTPTGEISVMVRDGETGSIVPQRDPQAMFEAMTRLLENPNRALLIARRARQEVDKYTWREVRKEWIAVYSGESA